jgi:hypothetical protein
MIVLLYVIIFPAVFKGVLYRMWLCASEKGELHPQKPVHFDKHFAEKPPLGTLMHVDNDAGDT